MNSELYFDSVMQKLKSALQLRTDKELAEKLGLSVTAYANLKKRKALPYEKVIELALAHGISLDYLFLGAADDAKGGGNQLKKIGANDWMQITNELTQVQIDRVVAGIVDMNRLNKMDAVMAGLKHEIK
ncbi:MAG: helix-turn-helix domain containing protein [Methylococcaceae bacterium]|nr:helix-turn-helix domain containing protein [Methylococcaceae bacterium]